MAASQDSPTSKPIPIPLAGTRLRYCITPLDRLHRWQCNSLLSLIGIHLTPGLNSCGPSMPPQRERVPGDVPGSLDKPNFSVW